MQYIALLSVHRAIKGENAYKKNPFSVMACYRVALSTKHPDRVAYNKYKTF